jgi:hypothetical protein
VFSVLPVVGVTEDAAPFVSALPLPSFSARVVALLVVLHLSLLRCAGYDSRVRVMMKRMAALLQVRWEWFVTQENRYAVALRAGVNSHHKAGGESAGSQALRYLKIGTAALIGGVAIGLTGGLLAAPLLGAGLAGIGLTSAGATVAAVVANTSGVILVSSLFGIGPHSTDTHNHRLSSLSPHSRSFPFCRGVKRAAL